MEKVAAVATEDPLIAANPAQAAMVAMPRPPRRWPTKPVGRPEQLAAHAGARDERAHQQEHRDHAERVVGDGAHRGLADHLQRRRAADEIAEATDPDETHRHADRHAQQHQREQHDEAYDCDASLLSSITRPSDLPASAELSGWKISR